MVSVGIRELRQRASELIRMVERGERVQITDRGRPVAILSPVEDDDPLERLIQEGRATRGTGDILDLELVPPREGVELPSKILERMREEERLGRLLISTPPRSSSWSSPSLRLMPCVVTSHSGSDACPARWRSWRCLARSLGSGMPLSMLCRPSRA